MEVAEFVMLVTGVMRLAGVIGQQETLPANEAQKIGFLFGTVVSYGIAFLSMILSPIIIYGGMQMLKGKRAGLAKAASILAMIPFTACCFVLGIPIGIWNLIILTRPEVKSYFNGERNFVNQNPPQPPTF